MSSVGQTVMGWGSTAYSAIGSGLQTAGHAAQVGGAKALEYGQIAAQKIGAGLVVAKDATVYYGGIALDKISAAAAAAKVGAVNGYAAAKPKAIALANSAQASFVAFNAAAVAKVGVVFDSVTKLSPAAVAPYSGYALLGITALGSGVLAGFVLKGRVIDLNKGLKDEVAEAISEEKKTEAAKVAVDQNGDVAADAETTVYVALTGEANPQPNEDVKDAVESVRTQLGMAKNRVADAKQALANAHVDSTSIDSAKQTLANFERDLTAAEQQLEEAKRTHEPIQQKFNEIKKNIRLSKQALDRYNNDYQENYNTLDEEVTRAREALEKRRADDSGDLNRAKEALEQGKAGPNKEQLEAEVQNQLRALENKAEHQVEREALEKALTELSRYIQEKGQLERELRDAQAKDKPDLTVTQTAVDSAQEAVNRIKISIQQQKATVDQAQATVDQNLVELKARLDQKVQEAEAAVNGFNAAQKVVQAVVEVIEKQQLEKIKAENAQLKGSWYTLKSAALKTAGVGLALFSTITTASTIGFVAGAAVPAVAAYGIGAAVPAATYFLVK